MGTPIRVMVVEDSSALTDRLTDALGAGAGVRVRGPIADLREAERHLDEAADVVVVGLGREDGRDRRIVAGLCERWDLPVLVAPSSPVDDVTAALAAGACGVLSGTDSSTIADAFPRAVSGELVLPAEELSSIVEAIRPPAARALARLTERERETLRLFAEGLATGEVAAHLGISVGTVQSHAKNVLAKLGVHSKVEAVRLLLAESPVVAGRAS
jgi:DNA-binding NarL/FixJ family response regulator